MFALFHRDVPLWEKTLCLVLSTLGLIGGGITTYTAIVDLVEDSEGFQNSCFGVRSNTDNLVDHT